LGKNLQEASNIGQGSGVNASSAAKGSSIRTRWLHRDVARYSGTLSHTPGHHVWIAISELSEIDLGDEVERLARGAAGSVLTAGDDRKYYILHHRLPPQQLVEFLKHRHAVGGRV
jgi:hypothetical protein